MAQILMLNPELQRYIWLNFSRQRLILMPLMVILALWIIALSTGLPQRAHMTLFLAGFIIFIFGTKCASCAVIDEINQRTWDFQRQTTLSLWSLTIGKLLGSTLYSWYAAIICLLMYALYGIYYDLLSSFKEILILITGGLVSQASAMLLSLQASSSTVRKSNSTFAYFAIGLIFGLSFTLPTLLKPRSAMLGWYGFDFNEHNFTLITLCFILFWVLLGLKRSLAKALHYPQIGWAWPCANIFFLLFFFGFSEIIFFKQINTPFQFPFSDIFLIAFVLTYVALLTDDLSAIRFRRKMTWLSLPWWTYSYGLSLIVALGLFIINHGYLIGITQPIKDNLIILTLFFMLRDILLVHYINFTQPHKAFESIVYYLLILYILLPFLLRASGLSEWTSLFWAQDQHLIIGLSSTLVQIILLSILLFRQYNSNVRTLN